MSSLLAIALVAGLGSAVAFGQSSGMLDDRTPPAQSAVPPPETPLSPEQRGDLFMARKMYREALEAFNEAMKNDPVVANKIGIAYHQMSQLDKAKKQYERALKLKPDYAEARNNLGTINYAKKSYINAMRDYLKAISLKPESASIRMNLGMAYFAHKDYEEATICFQQALQLDPNVFEHRGNYGIMLEERSVEERAKYHYYLAKLYAKGSRNDLALQYLRKALEEGFRDRKKLEQDPEFNAIRDTPEFQQLLTAEPRVL